MNVGSVVALFLVLVGCGTGAAKETTSPLLHSATSQIREWKLSGEPSMLYVGSSVSHRNSRIEVVSLTVTSDSGLSEKESEDWYLVRVKGGDDELTGHVFLAKWKPFSGGHAYIANIRGEPRNMLYSPAGNEERWEHATEKGDTWNLDPSPGAAQVGEELLAQYYKHVDNGKQEEIAPRNRKGREHAQELLLEPTRAALKSACHFDSATIDWSTVKDELMSEYSIADVCSDTIQTIIDFCESYPNTVAEVQKKSNVNFNFSRFSPPYVSQLDIENDEFVYYVGPSHSQEPVSGLTALRTHFGEMDQVLDGEKGRLIYRYGSGEKTKVYIGFGNRFYLIGTTPSWSRSTTLTRGIRRAYLDEKARGWSLLCASESLPLTRVVGEKRTQVLATAIFEKEEVWKREPYFLARDTHGVYYYVDRYQEKFGGRHYRVFVGKRGMLKLTKLKGLVEDSEGTVFSTQKGDLRLIVNPKASAIWIRGNKRSELTAVNPSKNRQLIYDELGVYLGEKLGHICDE